MVVCTLHFVSLLFGIVFALCYASLLGFLLYFVAVLVCLLVVVWLVGLPGFCLFVCLFVLFWVALIVVTFVAFGLFGIYCGLVAGWRSAGSARLLLVLLILWLRYVLVMWLFVVV